MDYRDYKAASTEDKRYLEHYGILGMHWGQRKAEKRSAKQANKQSKKDAKTLHKEEQVYIKDVRDKLNEKFKTQYSKEIKEIRKHLDELYDFSNDDVVSQFYKMDPTLEEYGDLNKAGRAKHQLIKKKCEALTAKVKEDYKDKIESPNGHYSIKIDDVDYAGDDGGGGEPYARIYDEQKRRTTMFMSDFNSEEEYLAHYGILGMKWGKRKEYTELSKGKQASISKKYKNHAIDLQKDMIRGSNHRKLEAYNQAVDDMNNGGIDKFNKTHKPSDKDYDNAYDKLFDNLYKKKFDVVTADFVENNKHYQKAQKLVEEYSLYKYDELAQKNKAFMEDIRTMGSEKMAKTPDKYL